MSGICLVGCGQIGRQHAKRLAGRAALYFHSRTRASADSFNHRFNGQGVFGSYEAVLASPEVSAVVICTPPALHAEQVVQALRAGKSVLVEKPMCLTEAEVEQIGRALNRVEPRVRLMVAENYYYKPSLKAIRRLIVQGAIGEIRTLCIKKHFKRSDDGWRSRHGALLEGGIHFLALMSNIVADHPVQVEARFPQALSGTVERHTILDVIYQGGVRAHLDYSWATPSLTRGALQHSTITGSRGTITFESNGLYVYLRARDGARFNIPPLADLLGYRAMTSDFLDCLADPDHQPYSSFERASRDLDLVFRAYHHLPQ